MIRRIIFIIISLILFMGVLIRINIAGTDQLAPESMMALGFTLIAAYLTGRIVSRFKLPKITGYIVAGIIAGPYLLNLLSVPVVQNLQLIDNIALSLIALTAGGEFRYNEVRRQIKTIGSTIIWKIIFVFLGFIIFFILIKGQIAFLSHAGIQAAIGVSLIIAALSVATSPATTIAVITETKAKGRFTDFVLAVTVFKDIIVVLLFSVAISLAKPMILGDSNLQFSYLLVVIWELLFSIGIGLAAGALILLYIKYVDKQRTLFLLGFVLLGIELSRMLHMELVLVFMVAGFFVQNYSEHGGKLIDAIVESSLPIYVVFFAIAGASLNIPVFLENWGIAFLIVILRMATTFQGTYVGGKLSKGSDEVNRLGWMGFIGQAGLSLGLTVLVVKNIPGEIGVSIRTLIISSIAINQIVGPVLFRYSLSKVGEIK